MNESHQHSYAQDPSERATQPQVDGPLVLYYSSSRTGHLEGLFITNPGHVPGWGLIEGGHMFHLVTSRES